MINFPSLTIPKIFYKRLTIVSFSFHDILCQKQTHIHIQKGNSTNSSLSLLEKYLFISYSTFVDFYCFCVWICSFDLTSFLATAIEEPIRSRLVKQNHHHVAPSARISPTLSHHPSLSSITSVRSSRLHPVSAQSCCILVLAGRPAFARPCEGVYRSMSFMSLSLLL